MVSVTPPAVQSLWPLMPLVSPRPFTVSTFLYQSLFCLNSLAKLFLLSTLEVYVCLKISSLFSKFQLLRLMFVSRFPLIKLSLHFMPSSFLWSPLAALYQVSPFSLVLCPAQAWCHRLPSIPSLYVFFFLIRSLYPAQACLKCFPT